MSSPQSFYFTFLATLFDLLIIPETWANTHQIYYALMLAINFSHHFFKQYSTINLVCMSSFLTKNLSITNIVFPSVHAIAFSLSRLVSDTQINYSYTFLELNIIFIIVFVWRSN